MDSECGLFLPLLDPWRPMRRPLGISGRKVLDSCAYAQSAASSVRTSAGRGLEAASCSLHCCPWPPVLLSLGICLDGLQGRCFLGTSCEPGCVLSTEARRWLTQGHAAVSSRAAASLPGGRFAEPMLLTSAPPCSRRGPCLALSMPREARQGGGPEVSDPEPQPRGTYTAGLMADQRQQTGGKRTSQGLATVCPDWWSAAFSQGGRVVTHHMGLAGPEREQAFFLKQSVKSRLMQRSGKALSTHTKETCCNNIYG